MNDGTYGGRQAEEARPQRTESSGNQRKVERDQTDHSQHITLRTFIKYFILASVNFISVPIPVS